MNDIDEKQIEYDTALEAVRRKKRRLVRLLPLIVIIDLIIVAVAVLYFLSRAPSNFPIDSPVVIAEGSSARQVAEALQEQNVVRSSSLLYGVLIYYHDPTKLKASTYHFNSPLSVFDVAERLIEGEFSNDLIRITFPEGFSVREYETFIPEVFEGPQSEVSDGFEGSLFPDTYFVPRDFTHDALISLMQETAEAVLTEEIANASETSLARDEIINLASIIEREANDEESMGLVSGILDNRMRIGMPLQVDATVAYGLRKSGTELTRVDTQTDGPYNTYTRTGLPPTPIANPGRAAIHAVLNPTPSEYLFYITGNDGVFYYAETLQEHNLNIARHLR